MCQSANSDLTYNYLLLTRDFTTDLLNLTSNWYRDAKFYDWGRHWPWKVLESEGSTHLSPSISPSISSPPPCPGLPLEVGRLNSYGVSSSAITLPSRVQGVWCVFVQSYSHWFMHLKVGSNNIDWLHTRESGGHLTPWPCASIVYGVNSGILVPKIFCF